jgi:hypothetical protein
LRFKGEAYAAVLGLVAGSIGVSIFFLVDALEQHLPGQIVISINIIFVTLLLLSLIIKFTAIFTAHHAVTSPNGDDFILGFSIGFDIPLVIVEMANGHLPFVG